MSSSGHSDPEDDDEPLNTASITSRADRGTRSEAVEGLRHSLTQESVEAYTGLLDNTFQDKPSTKEDNFNTTQDGIVIWTPQEKRILYQTLDKKGKNGIRNIAAAIESKSELEVQEYLRLLQKGLRHQHFNDAHPRAVVLGDIPAATEISEFCCDSLDEYAELLRLEEQLEEDTVGKEKHNGLWIINREIAEGVNSTSKTQDGTTETSPSIDVMAGFFKMTKWIQLSERMFMNFGGPRLEDNWVNVAFEDETPSMTVDAITDFYDIALSVTRRLVHAAHFFASSRVRKNEKDSRLPARVVRSSDVRRAARTLDMKCDMSDFWVGLARRCSLDVVDMRHKKGWNPMRLDHGQVEAILSKKASLPEEPYEGISPSIIPRRRSSSAVSEMSLSSLGEDETSDSEDEHAEIIDQRASAVEELQCWRILGEPPPENLNDQLSDEHTTPKPAGKRKTMEELVDWRERTLYRGEWEEYGHETKNLEKDLRANQRKRRRIELTSRPHSLSTTRGVVYSEIDDQTEAGTEAEPLVEDSIPDSDHGLPEPESRSSQRRPRRQSTRPEPNYTYKMDIGLEGDDDVPQASNVNPYGEHEQRRSEMDMSSSSDDYVPSP